MKTKTLMNKENKVKQQKLNMVLMALIAICLVTIGMIVSPLQYVNAQGVGDQILLKMRFAVAGVPGQGQGILQTGEVSTVSPAVATSTLTQVVPAPANLASYVRGVIVEKSSGATGTFTLQYGTGTNCASGATVILGPVTNPPIQLYYMGFVVPTGKAVCAQTDGSGTSVRLLYS